LSCANLTYDKVLVTGGAGFIGSHTVDALLSEGSEVWVLDDLSTGSLRNLRRWKGNRKLHISKNSLLQTKLVEAVVKRVDAIVHLAAAVSPHLSVRRPEVTNEVNVSGTLNVLRAAQKNGVKRFVFASSASVYGDQTVLPIGEDNPLHPLTPYGASKLAGEKYCEAFFRTYGLSTVSLRYFNVYGERQKGDNPYSAVIAKFAHHLSRGLRPSVYGDGEQERDFVYVSDVVGANLQALRTSNGIGDAFNVAGGHATTINQLFSVLAELFGKTDLRPIYTEARPSDIRQSYANMARSRTVLGFEPKVELKEGLKLLLDSISTQPSG
jgi:nucleoside-diphosphate-sugar epimerase